ncbi:MULTISPECIES: VOC family protein [Paenibacillus]|uniref:VOC family protein n=1 Tax=Paenibacillus TaxID=44249 RepID=UPI0022B90D94|nr:VOC family protein [Paenibacillus caseinilyticus]MCZ8522467.1 VOC family protein [Paenibacillus caseinilyticus]
MENHILGLFETHLPVADLERSAAFYENVLGLEFAHEDPRGVRFYWIGERGGAMLGLWEKGSPRGCVSILLSVRRWRR